MSDVVVFSQEHAGDLRERSASGLKAAQRKIGVAIAECLALWYVPVVSGVACNLAERRMVKDILETLGCEATDKNLDAIFWFFRKKMLVFNIATYAPWVGTSFQILEVYAVGQFTIRCATDPAMTDLGDETFMAARWEEIEHDILSGESVVASYEQFMEATFPEAIKSTFIKAVDVMSTVYRTAERIPGLRRTQEVVGETARRLIHGAKDLFRKS